MKIAKLLVVGVVFISACGGEQPKMVDGPDVQKYKENESDTADQKSVRNTGVKPDLSALQELGNSVNSRLIISPSELSATGDLKEFVPLQITSGETKIVRAFEITFRRRPDEPFSDRKLGPFQMMIQPKQSVQVNIFDSKITKEFESYSDESQFQVTKIHYSDGTVRNYGFITKLKL